MTEQQKQVAKKIVEGLAAETKRNADEFIDFGIKYGPRAMEMAAEGATDEDYEVLADVIFGELCVRGIMQQAAIERALKQILHVIKTAVSA